MKKILSIINGSYSVDEKLRELYNAYRWAESKEKKEQLELIYEYYRFAVKQFRTEAEGSVYVWKSVAEPAFYGKSSSYDELIGKIEKASSGVTVERFVQTEQGFEKLISVDFIVSDGTLCECGFTLNRIIAQADFEENDVEKFNKAERLLKELTE